MNIVTAVNMIHWYLSVLASIAFLPFSSQLFFDVVRYAVDTKDGSEPYRPVNYFINKHRKRGLCFFKVCWNHYAHCKTNSDCCECRCKEDATFFSDPDGCKNGLLMRNMTSNAGNQCLFVTQKFQFKYVPLFHDRTKFTGIELVIPSSENFPLNDDQTVCQAGEVHDYDYHGHKLLYHRNHCNALFRVDNKGGKIYLQFQSTNISHWNFFRGRLLSVDIQCYSPILQNLYSSCFLFQVEGKYTAGDDFKEPPEIPQGKLCPGENGTLPTDLPLYTVTSTIGITALPVTSDMTSSTTNVPTTFTEESTRSKTLVKTTTTTKSTAEKVIVTTAEAVNVTAGVVERKTYLPTKPTTEATIKTVAVDSLTGTTIGILTGLGTGLAVVMICIIILILIKKRKKMNKAQQSSAAVPAFPQANPYNGRNPYDGRSSHYDHPNVAAKPTADYPFNTAPRSKYTIIKEDIGNGMTKQYSYISDNGFTEEFETTDNSVLLQCRTNRKRSADMSKRPLPEKPMEASNPYYSVAAHQSQEMETMKNSDSNDLYTLYSTIEEL